MKTLFTALAIAVCLSLSAQVNPQSHQVKGYTKKNGTYVATHRQTNPNHTKKDNYSTKGNYNPYTGKKGTKKATR